MPDRYTLYITLGRSDAGEGLRGEACGWGGAFPSGNGARNEYDETWSSGFSMTEGIVLLSDEGYGYSKDIRMPYPPPIDATFPVDP